MATDGAAPTFGLWYDFRQRPPLGDYARFYAECLEEIEESEGLGFGGVWLSEHHFVDDMYLPITHEAALRSMRLFASEVASRVRDATET